MAEPRTKTLLHDLNAEFELLLEQNCSLAAELAQLKEQLRQFKGSCAAVGTQLPRRGMMQQNLAFLRDRCVPPSPAYHTGGDGSYENAAAPVNINIEPAILSTIKESGPDKKVVAPVNIESEPADLSTSQAVPDDAATGVSSEKALELHPQSDLVELHHRTHAALQDMTSFGGDRATKLWPAWQENAMHDKARTSSSMRLARTMSSDSQQALEESNVKYGAELRTKGCLQHLVARPSSPRQIIWDIFSMVFMCLDVLLVPLQAFPIPKTKFDAVVDWSSVIFWTVDLPNNFFTGFNKAGFVEMRPAKIANRYVRKLFVIDLTIAIVDWLVVLQTSNFRENGFVRAVKSYRVARALRLVRIIRVAKLLNMLVALSDHIAFFHSDTIRIVVDIIKIILFILVSSHFLACGWYAIGVTDELGEFGSFANSWVERFSQEQGGDPSIGYQYVTSLHWALTQFTPASMEVVPRNIAERIYAVVVLLLAVVTFSSFVSSITSSMTRLRIMNIERSKQREDIRRYIVDHRMTWAVGNRISQYLRKQDSDLQRRVHEEDVSLFKSLPEALKVDMHREVFLPVLIPHPFFYHYHEFLDDASLATICHTAMRERALGKGEYVFSCGESATHMFFLLSGEAEYTLGASIHDERESVEATAMLSEAVLWTPWLHAGRLLCSQHVELAMLDSLVMQGILRGQPAAKPARSYALQFLERQLKNKEQYTDLCTDISAALEMAQMAWCDLERITENTDSSLAPISDRRIHQLRSFARRMRNSFVETAVQITGK